MMDRNETFQNSRSDDLLWGSPVTAIELDPTPIDEWFKDKDLDKLCAEEFTFSNCKTSNNIDANLEIDYAPVLDLVYDEFQQFLDLLGGPSVSLPVTLKYLGLTYMKRVDFKIPMTIKVIGIVTSHGVMYMKLGTLILYLKIDMQPIVMHV